MPAFAAVGDAAKPAGTLALLTSSSGLCAGVEGGMPSSRQGCCHASLPKALHTGGRPPSADSLGHATQPGARELGANILALALLLLYAALLMGAKVTRLSLAKVLRAVRRAMERIRHGQSCSQFVEQLLAAVEFEWFSLRHPATQNQKLL